MSLESLLKLIKYVDEQILRYYTKVVEKFNLDKGKRKYAVGLGLNAIGGVSLCIGMAYYFKSNYMEYQLKSKVPLAASMVGMPILPDYLYNFLGIIGYINEDNSTESGTKSFSGNFLKEINSILRVPFFLGGAGAIADFLINLPGGDKVDSTISLTLGLGLLSYA